jgi:hypothetical protein
MADGHRDKRAKPGFVLNPMDDVTLRKCDTLSKTIMKRNQAVHFLKPVDWKKMGLHDYPKLIKAPMDLGTCSERLMRSYYPRLEDWANDMRLVWKNAFIFNQPDSMYFKAAKQLSDMFEKKLEEFEREAEAANNPQIDSMDRCSILLADLKANPLTEWFREPVDHVALGLTDYLKVISTPMDLATIGKKLERSQYLSTDDFAGDVRLVWQNAITYNTSGSLFGVVATILAQSFDRRMALITRSAAQDPGRPIPDRAGWPTFQQKKKFYDLCTKLTLADLNQLVGLVQRGCQQAVQQCGHKEVEVDVDELDMETFNKVMNWVNSKIKPA